MIDCYPESGGAAADIEGAVLARTGSCGLRLESVASPDDVADDWDELAFAAGNPFATREWFHAWWRHFGRGRTLAITKVAERAGRTVAILPLYWYTTAPFKILRFAGHGPADQLGPACAPQDVPAAAEALRQMVCGLPPHSLLIAERLSLDYRPALLGGRVVRREPSPINEIGGRSWDSWLSGKSANFRQQVRRLERRLARDHALEFRITEDLTTLDSDLTTFFHLHDRRWAEHGGSGALNPERKAFHRDFAEAALRRGWLRLWTAEIDGRPAASWYGFRYANRDWCYQLGRDPEVDRTRIGSVLMMHTIREACADGIRTYHFGLGDEDYKSRLMTDDPGVVTAALGRPRLTWMVEKGVGLVQGSRVGARLAVAAGG